MCLDLVSGGVKAILSDYPDAVIYPIFFATIKSSGFMVIKYIETVLVGSLSQPFTISHHSTKSMMVAASLLVARHRGLLALPHEDLFHIMAAAVLLLRMLDNLGSFKVILSF